MIGTVPATGRVLRHEVDVEELKAAVETSFQDQYGKNAVREVVVWENNPDVTDVVVRVGAKYPDMWDLCAELSEAFRQQGIRVGIRAEQADCEGFRAR